MELSKPQWLLPRVRKIVRMALHVTVEFRISKIGVGRFQASVGISLPAMTPSFSVVIPTYNMAKYLPGLWASLAENGVVELAKEVLFVDDCSTDNTQACLRDLSTKSEKLKILTLQQNSGRFLARFEGAKQATGDTVLFLDSRVQLPPTAAEILRELLPKHKAITGRVAIDPSRNIFCLYWDRSHRFLFANYYDHGNESYLITADNFESELKGTTTFACDRKTFIQACESFASNPVLNDDNQVMRQIVNSFPILVVPALAIQWEPRDRLGPFLGRLWERGPSFVEYHVFGNRGRWFWIVVVGLSILFAVIGLAFLLPRAALMIALTGIGLIALSTFLMGKNVKESLRMVPLHVAVVFTFGFGVMHGLWVNSMRLILRRRSTIKLPMPP